MYFQKSIVRCNISNDVMSTIVVENNILPILIKMQKNLKNLLQFGNKCGILYTNYEDYDVGSGSQDPLLIAEKE